MACRLARRLGRIIRVVRLPVRAVAACPISIVAVAIGDVEVRHCAALVRPTGTPAPFATAGIEPVVAPALGVDTVRGRLDRSTNGSRARRLRTQLRTL